MLYDERMVLEILDHYAELKLKGFQPHARMGDKLILDPYLKTLITDPIELSKHLTRLEQLEVDCLCCLVLDSVSERRIIEKMDFDSLDDKRYAETVLSIKALSSLAKRLRNNPEALLALIA